MDDLLQQGITAYKTGKRDEAQKIFNEFIKQNPESESGWGWLYDVSGEKKERIYCLKQMLRINPNNEKTKQLLDKLIGQNPPFELPQTNTVPLDVQSQGQAVKKCPYCAEWILVETKVCRYCGQNINPKGIGAGKIKAVTFVVGQAGWWLLVLGVTLTGIIIFGLSQCSH